MAIVLVVTMTPAAAATPQKELVEKARQTLNNFLFDEHLPTFHNHIKKAKALLIVPRFSQAVAGSGGSEGSAVLLINEVAQPGDFL